MNDPKDLAKYAKYKKYLKQTNSSDDTTCENPQTYQ